MPRPRALSFLGVRVHDVTFAETLAWMEAAIAGGRPRQICTVNPEFIILAQRDPAFRAVLETLRQAAPTSATASSSRHCDRAPQKEAKLAQSVGSPNGLQATRPSARSVRCRLRSGSSMGAACHENQRSPCRLVAAYRASSLT